MHGEGVYNTSTARHSFTLRRFRSHRMLPTSSASQDGYKRRALISTRNVQQHREAQVTPTAASSRERNALRPTTRVGRAVGTHLLSCVCAKRWEKRRRSEEKSLRLHPSALRMLGCGVKVLVFGSWVLVIGSWDMNSTTIVRLWDDSRTDAASSEGYNAGTATQHRSGRAIRDRKEPSCPIFRLQQVSEPPMLGLAPPSTGCATSLRQFQEHVLAVCTSICLPLYRVQFLLFVAISARSVSNPTDASCPPSGSSPRVRLQYASLSFSSLPSPVHFGLPIPAVGQALGAQCRIIDIAVEVSNCT